MMAADVRCAARRYGLTLGTSHSSLVSCVHIYASEVTIAHVNHDILFTLEPTSVPRRLQRAIGPGAPLNKHNRLSTILESATIKTREPQKV